MLTARTITLLITGLVLAAFVPYLRKSLQLVDAANDWSAWPRFEPRYVTGFALSAIAFGVSLIFSPGTWTELAAMPWWAVVGFASGGTLLGDQAGKATGKAGKAAGRAIMAKIHRR